MVNKKQKGTKKKKHQNAPEEEELLPDPNWCDLELFTGQNPMEPIQVMHATVTPITKFANAMMSIRQFWAEHVSWETAHAIATAISHQCVPWHEDWHQWRFAAQQFFNNLCTHRKKNRCKARLYNIGALRSNPQDGRGAQGNKVKHVYDAKRYCEGSTIIGH